MYSLQVALAEGMYALYIKDWFEVYPREQLKIIKMEEYSKSKTHILQDTVHFIGLGKLIGNCAHGNLMPSYNIQS